MLLAAQHTVDTVIVIVLSIDCFVCGFLCSFLTTCIRSATASGTSAAVPSTRT